MDKLGGEHIKIYYLAIKDETGIEDGYLGASVIADNEEEARCFVVKELQCEGNYWPESRYFMEYFTAWQDPNAVECYRVREVEKGWVSLDYIEPYC